MLKRFKVYYSNLILLGLLLGFLQIANAAENKIIAINVALDPGATMSAYAKSINEEMKKSYPEGFALDASHEPHITLLQRYVRLDNMSALIAAVSKIIVNENVTSWRLKASNYNFSPWDQGFLGSIVIEQNDELLKLQQKLTEATAPFTEKTGTSAAFFTAPAEPEISPVTVDYVTTFVPERTGKNYLPHITLGFASQDCKQAMTALPFKSLVFSPAGVSIYQIGNYGTARKKLKVWR